MGSHPPGRSGLGGAIEKLEGVDETAENAMKGNMQKGGRSLGRSNPKLGSTMDGVGRKVVNEDEEDKVRVQPWRGKEGGGGGEVLTWRAA